MVKTLPSNAGGVGLIPGLGTKIPHAVGQISPHTTTREKPERHKEETVCCNKKIPCAATKTQCSQKKKENK